MTFVIIHHAESVSSTGGVAHQIPSIIMPPTGTNRYNCNQPLLPISWSRRDPAAKRGSNMATRNTLLQASLTYNNAEATNVTNSINHQNSDRDARPLNSAYFVKHTRIDSKNVTLLPSLLAFEFNELSIFNSLPIKETVSLKDVTQFRELDRSPFSVISPMFSTVECPRLSQFSAISPLPAPVDCPSFKTNSILELT